MGPGWVGTTNVGIRAVPKNKGHAQTGASTWPEPRADIGIAVVAGVKAVEQN